MATKNPKLPKAHQQIEYTQEQLDELERCSRDPIYCIKNYFRIQHPTRGAIPYDLYEFQEDLVRLYHSCLTGVEYVPENVVTDNCPSVSKNAIVTVGRQSGKPISITEMIPTPTGFTKMGDLGVGDYVLNAEGKPTLVTSVTDIMYNHDCYRVVFDTGEEIIADADHLWEVRDKLTQTDKKILTTAYMASKKYVNHKNEARYTIRVAKPIELPEVELPMDPYTFGCWLGDGSSADVVITNHLQDKFIIEQIEQQYKVTQIKDHRFSEGTKMYGFRDFGEGSFRDDLKATGAYKNKHIPMLYLRASYQQRLALLQGLMDTDGCCNKSGYLELTFTNEQLALDARELIASLGQKPSYHVRDINGQLPHRRYTIAFTAYSSEIKPFRLPRKLALMKEFPHPTRVLSTKRRSIQKIEKVDSVPVRCIVVDNPDHLFLVGRSFIPTHNSQTSAAFLLWFGMFHDDKTILVASNHNGNAMELVNRMQYMFEELPLWLKPGVNIDGWNKHEIGFDNGSRIISQATTEKTGRGLSISVVFVDELAFIRPSIQQAFWTSISPTLSTGGFCIITSTPNGDSDLFAELWRGALAGVNGFKHLFVDWRKVPGRDERWAEQERGKIGELKFRQEFECELISSDALLFDSIFLTNLTRKIEKIPFTKNPLGFLMWEAIQERGTYLVSVDPATGSGSDFTVIEVFSFPQLNQVMEYRSNTTATKVVYQHIKKLLQYLESKSCTVYFSLENNTIGEGLISLYEVDENFPVNVDIVSGDDSKERIGFRTDNKAKLKSAVALKTLVETGRINIRSRELLQEMKNYVRKGGSYAAQIGSTDDAISSMMILTRMLVEIASFEDSAYQMFYSVNGDDITDEINLFNYETASKEADIVDVEAEAIDDLFELDDSEDDDYHQRRSMFGGTGFI